jgi:hypothetical protein
MKLVMLGHDEGGEFHRTACLEDVKEFLYMLEMAAVPLEPTEAMNYDGSVKLAQTTLAKLPETRTTAIYKAMISAAQEEDS